MSLARSGEASIGVRVAPAPAHGAAVFRRGVPRWVVPIILTLLLAAGWELVKAATGVPRSTMPHLWQVLAYLGVTTSHGDRFGIYLLKNTRVTFQEGAIGLLVGGVCGFALGALIALNRWVGRGVLPFVVGSQTVPIVAIAPAVVIWLGTGWSTKAVIAGYLTFFPITVTTSRGLSDISADSLALMRSYGASPWQVFFNLRLPAALPMIFTGLETAAAFAVIGAIVGELPVGSPDGVGVVILTSWQFYNFAPEALYGAVGAAFCTGIALVLVMKLVERMTLRHRRNAA